jgi:hypothetical protein
MPVNPPDFFAFVPGPADYVSVMAEALAAGNNVFAGTWLGGSAAEAIEIVTTDSDIELTLEKRDGLAGCVPHNPV